MDGKEPYSSSSGFSSSYYINIPENRGISSSATAAASAQLPAGLHSFHVPPAAFQPNPMSPLSMHHQQQHQHSRVFEMDSPSTTHPAAPIPAQGDHQQLPALIKKKRGRPRKYGPDGKPPHSQLRSSQPSSRSSAANDSSTSAATALGSLPGAGDLDSQKKKRGRPPGTGRKQQLASLGEWFSGSAGTAFTPHVIIVHPDENVVSKIMAFSNQGPRAVSVLSANGSVSTVTLCQSESSGVVTYEGLFEILSLSGSYLLTESDGSRTRSGGLTITLSGPDGRVLGGILGGVLIASTSVQVVLGSFLYGSSKSKTKNKNRDESDVGEEESEPSGTLLAQLQHQNLTAVPPTANWPSSRMLDMRTSSIDINLTRG